MSCNSCGLLTTSLQPYFYTKYLLQILDVHIQTCWDWKYELDSHWRVTAWEFLWNAYHCNCNSHHWLCNSVHFLIRQPTRAYPEYMGKWKEIQDVTTILVTTKIAIRWKCLCKSDTKNTPGGIKKGLGETLYPL